MKRIFKSMFLMASAVAVAMNFASCKGDDDGEDNNSDDKVLIEDENGAKYTVKISDLNDSGKELSYTVTLNFIAPEEIKVEYQNIFEYSADAPAVADSVVSNDSVNEPASVEVEKDLLPVTLWKYIVTCDKDEYLTKVYNEIKTDSADFSSYVMDGNTITCIYADDEMTYAEAKAYYEEEKAELKSEIEKAKKEASANNNKPENGKENTNTKTNYNFNKDSVGAIVNVDSTIGYTVVKSGVASVYSFGYDKNGNITNGTIVCECKNSDVAKAYAKEHMRDRNDAGDRIYKSVSLDGNKVIMIYSDAALEGLTKDSIVDAQKSGSNPLASDSGSEQNDEESADAGDDNQSVEPETPATQE